MVVSQLIGGLGNQMFQYAIGRALSIKNRAPLLVDTSNFKNYGLHQGYELGKIFSCDVKEASENDIKKVLGWQRFPIIQKVLHNTSLVKFRSEKLIIEPHFQYWSGIEKVPQDIYLIGYWQSEKYFHDVRDQIRKDFTFRLPLNEVNKQISEQILSTCSVGLHIRRGDYVNNLKAGEIHGVCSIEYYQEAVNYVAKRTNNPNFFIFSDDISWARENLKIKYRCHYVDNNTGVESYNDMHLMSMCQHNIIANSSFSWWGAWLSLNPKKIIIAPKKWFNDNSIKTKDILPKEFLSL